MKAKIIVSVVFYNSNKCVDVVNNALCHKIVI